jgi:DNA mismatch repair protein MutH
MNRSTSYVNCTLQHTNHLQLRQKKDNMEDESEVVQKKRTRKATILTSCRGTYVSKELAAFLPRDC